MPQNARRSRSETPVLEVPVWGGLWVAGADLVIQHPATLVPMRLVGVVTVRRLGWPSRIAACPVRSAVRTVLEPRTTGLR